MTWLDWIAYHGTLFCMTDEKEGRTLAQWSNLLRDRGFTPEEAKAASARLATAETNSFRGDHVHRICALVRDARMSPMADDPVGKASVLRAQSEADQQTALRGKAMRALMARFKRVLFENREAGAHE